MKNYFSLFLQLTIFSFTIKAQTRITDNCNFFPIKNGLKFTYKRTNMMGTQTITESYTTVKDKILTSGKLIKGYKINSSDPNRNNTTIYYYCEKGVVKMYSEMPDYNTSIVGYAEDYSLLPADQNKPDHLKTPIWETEKTGSGKYLSFTELKPLETGNSWTDVQLVNGNTVIITSTVSETDLTEEAGGKMYAPVIHITRSVHIKNGATLLELNTQNIYYAQNIGKIKTVETGTDLLFGRYTTTQELIAHNLTITPATTSGSKPNTTAPAANKTTPYKLGDAAIEAICDKWCGSYKLIEKNKQPVSDFPYGEYLHLETEGDAISLILQKKNGKLYETGKQTDLGWTVWMENGQQVIYIRTAAEIKGQPVSQKSVARKKIIFDNKVYEYVKREIEYY
jgi:hypothetical protein